jgi:hypothetical protein
MKSNKVALLVFFTLLCNITFCQTWPIHDTDDPNNWNSISSNFGEIHPTNADHFHGT